MANVYRILKTTLDDIADAIRAKTGSSSSMTPAQMVTEIESIQTGGGSLPTGMTHIGSGSFTFASRTSSNTKIVHGLNFTPRFVMVWASSSAGTGADVVFCGMERILFENPGTTSKTIRYLSCVSIGSSGGYENTTYPSNDADFFVTATFFNVGHGARYYTAGLTYSWFAFD